MSIRDSYCTPPKITRRLPRVDYDPCSNPRSTVKADRTSMLERGENGLLESWEGLSVGINPPWSCISPWAYKIWEAKSFWLLVLEDASTEWWEWATQFNCYRFSFNERIDFVAPPDIETSTNDRPTCLIVDPTMRAMIGDNFKGMGRWWHRE